MALDRVKSISHSLAVKGFSNLFSSSLLLSLASRNAFANDPAMLVFLQTGLSEHQMDYYLKTRTPGGIRSLVLRLHDKKLRKDEEQRRPRRKTISAEYPLTER